MCIKCEHRVAGESAGITFRAANWNGPIGTCGCCGQHFGYVNSVTLGEHSSCHGRTWTPEDRCGACGGAYKEWVQPEVPK